MDRPNADAQRPALPTTARLARAHAAWLDELDRCVGLAERPEACAVRSPAVSAWSVGEQLEHLLLADRAILQGFDKLFDARAEGRAVPEGGRPTWIGWLVLKTGYVPRGRARAPDRTAPAGMEPAELAAALSTVRGDVEALRNRLGVIEAERATRSHPLLGDLSPALWVRFSFVHHRHHRKIIRDILKRAPATETPRID